MQTQARQFAELFRAVYLTFHRRDGPRSQLPNASLAVLEHLALAGPLTMGEAAAHLCRAQSVVSEIVSHLERRGMLEREKRPGRPAPDPDLADPGRARCLAPPARSTQRRPARRRAVPDAPRSGQCALRRAPRARSVGNSAPRPPQPSPRSTS